MHAGAQPTSSFSLCLQSAHGPRACNGITHAQVGLPPRVSISGESLTETSSRDIDHIQSRQLSFRSFSDSSSLLGEGRMVEPSHLRPLRMEAGDEDSRVDQSGCPQGLYRASAPAPDISLSTPCNLHTLEYDSILIIVVLGSSLSKWHTTIALKATWTLTNFAAPSIVPAGCGWCSTDFSTSSVCHSPFHTSFQFLTLVPTAPFSCLPLSLLDSDNLWDVTSEGFLDPSLV